tara:strand:+ start:461 stop:814 length:354 start_codon:yes stop_codon:yes gene_type:complete
MIFWILQQIIISIILIASIHYIILYLKKNLTVPKTKDLVKKPVDDYKKMFETSNNTTTNDDMKNELKKHIQGILSKSKEEPKNNHTPLENNDSLNNNIINNSGEFFNTSQNAQYSLI